MKTTRAAAGQGAVSATGEAEMAEGALALVPGRVPATSASLRQARMPDDEDMHPDGRRAAFVLREWVADQPKQVARIWTVPLEGGHAAPLTAGPGNDTHPRWSPDGQSLAFLSTRNGERDGGKAQVYVMPGAGGAPRRVSALPNGVESFAWSPDGRCLALLALEGNEPAKDPLVILPDRHRRLWVVPLASDQPAPATPLTPANVTIWEYAWSSDSQQLAVYFSTGPGETDWYRGQVGVVPAEGGAVRLLTQLTRQAAALTWSPDSSRIAYISGEWSDRGLVGGEVFTIPASGGTPRNLTPKAALSLSWVRWFPEGNRMLYASWDGVSHQIGLLDEASGMMTPLSRDISIGGGGWPRLSTTPDLRTIVTHRSDRQHPPDIWAGVLTFSTSTSSEAGDDARLEWRQLTHLNALIEETLLLAPAEVITWESVDGWRIEGLFTRPLTMTRGTPPPLVVQVHGGPSSAWQTDWRGGVMWAQMCASAGFAVFQPNIRGSIGRGVAFADAVLTDPGGKDLQDILSGIEHLIARGLVDGERVGIIGWSYGGFMTAWAVSQTQRFKAAMMGAGICDFHSFHAQTNIADWDMRTLGADPLKHPDVYRARSAITCAANITTPTLILHGEQDPCVPVNQAYAFHRALLERNVPTELVVYPRAGHGLAEREHIRDADDRILRWLETYL